MVSLYQFYFLLAVGNFIFGSFYSLDIRYELSLIRISCFIYTIYNISYNVWISISCKLNAFALYFRWLWNWNIKSRRWSGNRVKVRFLFKWRRLHFPFFSYVKHIPWTSHRKINPKPTPLVTLANMICLQNYQTFAKQGTIFVAKFACAEAESRL